MEISVFVKGQDHTCESAQHRGTRTVANLVLALSLAKRIGQNAIILTTEQPWREVKKQARLGCRSIQHSKFTYIPDTLPPVEVGNHRFQEPQSPSWQNEHAIPSRYLKTRARLMRLALGFDKPRKAECLQS